MATTSTLSRRASEFAGVALFAASLIWLIALVTHEPRDPVWFFTAGDAHRRRTSSGSSGRSLSEVSLQVLGYASYLVPVVLGVVGWNLFWCRRWTRPTRRRWCRNVRRLPERAASRSSSAGPRSTAGRSAPAATSASGLAACAGVPEPAWRDHRRADTAGAGGDPLDAVLVRTHVPCALRDDI